MSSDKRFVNKLPERVRREDTPGIRIDSGPFIGIIKNNNDPIRSGRLQVWIPDLGGEEGNPQNWRTVAYASPFAGVTYQPNTSKNNKFSEVQHSYGMWAVPPDIGNQVICLFINGDANRGYWFACVNPNLSHHMVPGLASSNNVDNSQTDPSLKNKFDSSTSNWPVGEFNENNQTNIKPGWSNNLKPVHEFQANVLVQQGLDRDTIRGAIKSSSQRESPSTVFGISTPGRPINDPMENPTFESKLKAGTLTEADYAVRGRKGGHTFVMDDGEQMGASQLMRLRTAGGHQLLMNDSDRVVYLANSDGSVWLEFTGAGFINLYSSSGINLRTEGDFNIHSDKNVNIHANENIKMKAGNLFATQSKDWYAKSTSKIGMHTGKFNLLVDGALSMQSASGNWNAGSKLVLKGDKILLNTETPGAVPEVPTLKTFKQADTSWDSAKGLWVSKDEVYESISPIAPSHEPWTRGAGKGVKGSTPMSAPAPQPEKQTSVCAPPPGTSVTKPAIAPVGVDGESLIVSALQQAGKTDPVMIASIVAQCAHESGNFKFLKELGADSYFAKYEGRKDLGNTQPGDGLKFKGRGYIQITGRDVYDKAGKYLGIDLINNPLLAEDPVTAAKLVVYFFFEYKKGRTTSLNWDDVTAVTRVVNGGTNGLEDRKNKYAVYKQKYASGVVTTGTGATVVDGSGSPVLTGGAKLDPGPESAKGKPVEKPAPASKMSVQGAPNPAAIPAAGPKIPGLIPTQLKALMVQIGFAESGCDYTDQDTTLGRIGYYKINGNLLRDYGYIKKDHLSQYGKAAIFRDDAWTGKDGVTGPDSFMGSAGVQNSLMETILNDYYKALTNNRGIFLDDDVCTVAGMLSVAYFLRDCERSLFSLLTGNPPDQAKFWREQGDNITNKQKQSCNTPYNQGRYAIDVLSIATVASTPPASPISNAPDTTGIDPESVFNFTGPTGTRESFNQLDATFRSAILRMAKDYKDKTGKKVTLASAFRSQADQERIYSTWQAAGGVIPGRPTAAGITTPAKPVSLGGKLNAHGKGQAIDCGQQATEINETLDLSKYGLRWGGTFSVPDRVHIQMA